MKKKIAAFLSALTLLVVVCGSFGGVSGARYRSAVTFEKPIDYSRTVGQISLYEPTTILGYEQTGNYFPITNGAATVYDNIRFEITNTITRTEDGVEKTYKNDVNTPYYIRIVPKNSNESLAIEYKVYKLNAIGETDRVIESDKIYPETAPGVYGPIDPTNNLSAKPILPPEATEEMRDSGDYFLLYYFSVYVAWKGTGNLAYGQAMSVQMVKKCSDNSFKVIDETDLNIKTKFEASKVMLQVYHYNMCDGNKEIGTMQELSVPKGSAINETTLKDLMPANYKFFEMYCSNMADEGYDFSRHEAIDIPNNINKTHLIVGVFAVPKVESITATIEIVGGDTITATLPVDPNGNIEIVASKLNDLLKEKFGNKYGETGRGAYVIYIQWSQKATIYRDSDPKSVSVNYFDKIRGTDENGNPYTLSLSIGHTLLIKSWW